MKTPMNARCMTEGTYDSPMTQQDVPTLLLTGTVGSGKTAIADEISVLLEEAGVRHAVIDVDRVCQLYPPP